MDASSLKVARLEIARVNTGGGIARDGKRGRLRRGERGTQPGGGRVGKGVIDTKIKWISL